MFEILRKVLQSCILTKPISGSLDYLEFFRSWKDSKNPIGSPEILLSTLSLQSDNRCEDILKSFIQCPLTRVFSVALYQLSIVYLPCSAHWPKTKLSYNTSLANWVTGSCHKKKGETSRRNSSLSVLVCWFLSGCHEWCILSKSWIQQCWQTKSRRHHIKSFENLGRFFNLAIIHFQLQKSNQT